MSENSKIDDGGAAFPGMAADGHRDYSPGLSRRDYFAAAALTGLLAYPEAHLNCGTADRAAAVAFELADAMIAASKPGGA